MNNIYEVIKLKNGKIMKTKEEILKETIANYNSTVNDMSKFQFNKRETELFLNMMELFASQGREWIPVTERLPLSFETGNWDGKRSELVLCLINDEDYVIGRVYQGFMDGTKFADWYDSDDMEIEIKKVRVTHWQNLYLPIS